MNELGGYVGRFLYIDLSTGDITQEIPHISLLKKFIGGYGVGARVLYEQMNPGADPLGPENILGFVTGPLTGTPAIMASRYCVVGKSPLTGGWGDANSGGFFGPTLKYAGYDAVFFKEISQKPTYLYIDNGQAKLYPADDLWGLDTIKTEDALQARHGADVRVACIGPAGERLSLISAIINDRGRAAGRSGLGAVMGSKLLKAIAVRGDQQPHVANTGMLKTNRNKFLPLFKTDDMSRILNKYGTSGITKAMASIGRAPIKNWSGNFTDEFMNYDGVDGPAFEEYQIKKYACWRCVQACGGIVRWEENSEYHEDHRPEYETLALVGTNCGIDNPIDIMRINELCNRGGLDTISAGACIAFAMECYQNGILTGKDLNGLRLEWGNGDAALRLVESVIERRGLGDVLADGVKRASEKLGQGTETFAIHAGGQELPAHDPRQEQDFGLAYQISPTPGRHTQGGVGARNMPPEHQETFGLDQKLAIENPLAYQARAYALKMSWRNVLNAAGLCSTSMFTLPPSYVPEFIAAVTGWDYDMQECFTTGERIEVIRLLFGLREGYNPLQIQLPKRVMGQPPLQAGPTAGVKVEIDNLRDAYLELMDWDALTAYPGAERLCNLGLSELIGDTLRYE